jgi:hypothetical protein
LGERVVFWPVYHSDPNFLNDLHVASLLLGLYLLTPVTLEEL